MRTVEWSSSPELGLQANNGTLSAGTAARAHQGLYRCQADNGVGPPLVKHLNITVHGKKGTSILLCFLAHTLRYSIIDIECNLYVVNNYIVPVECPVQKQLSWRVRAATCRACAGRAPHSPAMRQETLL